MSVSIKDISGQRFGRLLVAGIAGRDSSGNITWKCQCDCGNEKAVAGCNLRSGHVVSCGCYHRERLHTAPGRIAARLRSHLASVRRSSRVGGLTYRAWSNMKDRCYNPRNQDYVHYGQRGISVCERWRNSFTAFVSDMGLKPEGKSLDRINVDGNYEPENCRWATCREQIANRRPQTKRDWFDLSQTTVCYLLGGSTPASISTGGII